MVVGFTNGCFDLLHEGHLHFLRECRKHCDDLVVALNTGASIRKLKGEGRPIWTMQERAASLRRTGLATSLMSFDTESELENILQSLKPDILFKGEDYKGRVITGSQHAKLVKLIPLLPGVSTTGIVNRGNPAT